MPSFAPPARPQNQLGKIDRWLVNFFTFSTLLFAASYVIAYVYDISTAFESTSVFFASVVLLKALTVPAPRNSYRGRATVVISLLFAVALFNMVISMDIVETSLRWLLWFWIVVALNRVAGASDGSWIPALIRRLPVLFAIIYVTLIVVARTVSNIESQRFAEHLSGLYGNLIFCSGLFAGKLWQRLMWSCVGFITIFMSGAAGALFTVPIMFIPYILYSASSMPVKGIGVAMLLSVGGVFFFSSQLFGNFLDIKVNQDPTEGSYTGLDRLDRSRNMRLQLVQYGLAKVAERPVGTGLGHTYADELSRLYYVSHVHNGTITMLVELGIPGFAVVAGLLAWIMLTILRSTTIEDQLKGFYFTYAFTIFGRSLSENYTPFDLGNFFNFVFLVLTISLFLHQRTARFSLPSFGYMPPPGGFRPPSPGWRPLPPPRPLPG